MSRSGQRREDDDAAIKPALAYRRLTPIYDPLMRATLRERRFKRQLVEQAGIEPGHRVLDLGCGSATLTVLVKQLRPGAEVVGVDADPEILRLARQKIVDEGLEVSLEQASAMRLPFADGRFDRVLTSLMFHHLTREHKREALADARRVLRPGGELHVADWGRAHGPGMRALFLLVQLLDGFETTRDSVAGALPGLMVEAGFAGVDERSRLRTVFGTIAFYSARRSAE
ncbi:MAG: methyltransferase domain-containing protein [Thermoanaerobaculia bacterium]